MSDPQQPLLTVDELAARLNVDRRWVYRAVAEHMVPVIRMGRLLRFDPDEIAAWLDKQRVKAGS